jgi:proteic killer suppression protein
MHIEFASNKLKRQMGSEAAMQKAYGDRANRLKLRLGVLKNAMCLADVPTDPPPRCHALKGDYSGSYAVDISGNWRLIFEPILAPSGDAENTQPNPSEVTAIRILGVIDYH